MVLIHFKIDFPPFRFFFLFLNLQNAPHDAINVRMVSNFEQRFKNVQ